MKCFHFSNGGGEEEEEEDGVVSISSSTGTGTTNKLSTWARSLSVASTNIDTDSRREWAAPAETDLNFYLTTTSTQQPRVFTFSELKLATRGFSRALLIGEGGFGCVYRATIPDNNNNNNNNNCVNVDVAIKQLNRNGFQGHKEWINEVNFLGIVNHPNLVKLVGYCADDDERGIQRLLVYELMRNNSLEDHLLSRSSGSTPLPWILRLRIAQDAARGLAYLHEQMEFQLIFRDFKTSNILLDQDFNAKLSDFGLARQGPTSGIGHISTSVVGTVGYAAPEYVHTGRLTAKSDVWSFGVVLFELITGRRVLERNLPRGEQKLLEWVRPFVSDPKKFHLILDQRLEGHICMNSARKLASLANKCLMKQPRSRPKMSEVIDILGSIISEVTPLVPSQCVHESVEQSESAEAESLDEEPGGKLKNKNRKKGFDFRDMVLRNRSIGKLDWRN